MLRAPKGQALVQGVGYLGFLAAAFVTLVSLLIAAGVQLYYTAKFAHVARGAARFASHRKVSLGARRPNFNAGQTQTATQDITQQMLAAMGYASNAFTVTVDQSGNETRVDLSVSGLQLVSSSFFPAIITVRTSATIPDLIEVPPGVLGLSFCSGPPCQGMYLPSYGKGGGTPGPTSFPFGGFPYWESGVFTSTTPALDGPKQNNDAGGAFSGF